MRRMRSLGLSVKLIVSPLRNSNAADYMFRNGVDRRQLQIIAELKTNESAISLMLGLSAGSPREDPSRFLQVESLY